MHSLRPEHFIFMVILVLEIVLLKFTNILKGYTAIYILMAVNLLLHLYLNVYRVRKDYKRKGIVN
jgi:hypothetical protein